MQIKYSTVFPFFIWRWCAPDFKWYCCGYKLEKARQFSNLLALSSAEFRSQGLGNEIVGRTVSAEQKLEFSQYSRFNMATGKGYFPLLGRSYSTNIDLSLTSDSNKIKHGIHCDVALKISQDRRLRAHGVVLVSLSPYFKALLGKHWDDGVEK